MRRLLLFLLVASALGLLARGAVPCSALAIQPACYVALNPGPVADALTIVEIDDDRTYASSGSLLLTTVAVDTTLDVGEWVSGALSARTQQLPRELLFPPGADDEQVRQQNAALMEDSKLDAVLAALRALEVDFDTEPDGARVIEIAEFSRVDRDALAPGDIIVAAEGRPIASAAELAELTGTLAPGDVLALTVRGPTDPGTRTVEVELVENPDAPGAGLIGIVVGTWAELPIDIQIDAGSIGGPSAGLMFSLAIVDLLGPDDLTGGHVIAGTGTIDREGNVGAIGGIQQKILGALQAPDRSASVFLVPADNFEEARQAPVGDDILLVPVATLDDALSALADLRAGRQPAGALALPAG